MNHELAIACFIASACTLVFGLWRIFGRIEWCEHAPPPTASFDAEDELGREWERRIREVG
jgi:hypothetical protein